MSYSVQTSYKSVLNPAWRGERRASWVCRAHRDDNLRKNCLVEPAGKFSTDVKDQVQSCGSVFAPLCLLV